MKRLRTYFGSRGASRDAEKSSGGELGLLRSRSPQTTFSSSQAPPISAQKLPEPPHNSSVYPPRNKISNNSSTRNKIRKPPPRSNAKSNVVPFPRLDPAPNGDFGHPKRNSVVVENHSPFHRSHSTRIHGRSQSVRVVVPDNAILGTIARTRSLSAPHINRVSGRFGFGGPSYTSISNSVHGPLEVVPEHGDDEITDREHNIVRLSFSDPGMEYNEDGSESEGGHFAMETESVQSIRPELLDNLSATELNDHYYNSELSYPTSSDSGHPLNISSAPGSADHALSPISMEGPSFHHIDDKESHAKDGDRYIPDSSLDSNGTTLEDHIEDSNRCQSSPQPQPAARALSLKSTPLDLPPNYTPLLQGMSSVISLGGSEYLIVLESLLDGPARRSPLTGTTDIRVRVVGGGQKLRERLHPDAYVVMFIEGAECLVRVIRELRSEDSRRIVGLQNHGDTPIWNNSSRSTMSSDTTSIYDSNPHRISWLPGMHLTVTLGGDIFLVVQIERLRTAPLLPSTGNGQRNLSSNLKLSSHPETDDSSVTQIASIDSVWWALPETGKHVVLILGCRTRRQEYLVQVVRRLTTTGSVPEPEAISPKALSRSKSRSISRLAPIHDTYLDEQDANRFQRVPRRSVRHRPSISNIHPAPQLHDTSSSTQSSDIVVLARGYRYLTTDSDGSGTLRFELLLEDRVNEWYAFYMLLSNGRSPQLNWVVSGGQSQIDASWVFKKGGKSPPAMPGNETRARRGASESSATSVNLPHDYLFEKETPNDAWVFKPMSGGPSPETQSKQPVMLPSESQLPNLQHLLSTENSALRNSLGFTIFVSRLVFRKDRDMVVFCLSPASKEEVRELSRRVTATRELEVKKQKKELADRQLNHSSGPFRKISEDSHEPTSQSLTLKERVAHPQDTQFVENPERGHLSSLPYSLRTLCYGRQGELVFAPFNLQRVPSRDESEVPASPSNSSTRFTGNFLVYTKADPEIDTVDRDSYIFYPADHDGINTEYFPRPPNTEPRLRRFNFKTNHETDAWMFVPADDVIEEHPSTTPLSGIPPAGGIFRASMDNAGKITLNRQAVKPGARPLSLTGDTSRTTLTGTSNSPQGSVSSVKSESNVATNRRRPLSDRLMKNTQVPKIGGPLKSLVSEI
ncbi:hypothetical protein BDP27DRAFT_1416670 [Rhodocollybia butyracea]|uniref:Uncharacterized protein n=1 Tax=Rhodocollybia butyracea TaxID=206335 RepID=A0A9P5PWT1_9AGAR|nr:hypothetical protein BDP27DRAFT_1416670 [Rhodocollybia butyracea]